MPALRIKSLVVYGFILLCGVFISFIFTQGPFSNLTLQLLALVTIGYTFIQFLARKTKLTNKPIIDAFLLTFFVHLILFSSGGLSSPAFFLIYFLLFGIALLFDPTSAVILAFISSFFLFTSRSGELLADFLSLSSLFLIAPLAQIFGSQYINLTLSEQKNSLLTKTKDLLEKEVNQQEDVVLTWTSDELKTHLKSIYTKLNSISTNTQSYVEKAEIEEALNELRQLLASAEEMKKKVEK